MPAEFVVPDAHNPAEAFAAVVALRRLAANLERGAVDSALDQGWTWAQIGQALGMSAQAAHKRLAPPRLPATPSGIPSTAARPSTGSSPSIPSTLS